MGLWHGVEYYDYKKLHDNLSYYAWPSVRHKIRKGGKREEDGFQQFVLLFAARKRPEGLHLS